MIFWAFTPAKVVIYTLKCFGALFNTRPEIFPPFKQVYSLDFICTAQHLVFLKMEFNPFPDSLNTGFSIIEICLFYGGKHWSENMQIPDFIDKMAMFT